MPAPIVIVDYDPRWPLRFEAARTAITRAVGGLLVSIEHVGSTAVPGLAAKPIIDIMPGIRRFEDGYECVAPLEALGYEYRGEYGFPGRYYFVKDDDEGKREQQLHMLVAGSDPWTRHILFRDLLRANPHEAEQYARLKRSLAERYRHDREAYAEAKTTFIEGALERAKAWVERPSNSPARGKATRPAADS